MWEPGSISNKTASTRDVVLLVSALTFCFFLYQVWGPLLFITCSLVFVVHTCYSLYVHDSIFAPNTKVFVKHAGKFSLQLAKTAVILTFLSLKKSKEIFIYLKEKYQERQRRFLETEDDMNGRQRNVYRLSTSGTDYPEQSSPVNNDPYQLFAFNGACNNARCSTPIPRVGLGGIWKKDTQPNGSLGLLKQSGTSPVRKSPSLRSENRQPAVMLPRNEETLYSPKGSPWGTSISPKMEKPASGKAIQTVAGPLLASTRYNIDPKVYTDVSSPGITSRISKYAAEANCKLTHQSQYGPGQFPKVNLNAMPAPVISAKTIRARMPVTVRVAPPDIVNYSLHDHSFQDRHKVFTNTSGSEVKETKSCPSVNQVLKEISLKRHASREDIMLDLVKKQRTEKVSEGQLENLEEMMQKRARDESSNSEDDISPKKSQRPTKRSKSSSCHDILNSLSSSVNVYSGVKRKAMDSFQSESPENEKHFKPSSKSSDCSFNSTSSPKESVKSKEQLNVIVPVVRVPKEVQTILPEKTAVNAELNKGSPERKEMPKVLDQSTPKSKRESVIAKPTKLEDKLFMKADPQPNRKLKILAEEQANLEVNFQSDDKEEIKKKDIDYMKQNSMRLRLQSMYDAISGKSSSKIDPDVVIQAEEVNPSVSSDYVSLNSLTSTTTVNTSPITTTIVPILKSDTEIKSSTPKRVTFNLQSSSSTFSSTSTTVSTVAGDTSKQAETKTVDSELSKALETKTTSTAPMFNFGSGPTSTSTTVSLPATTVSSISSGFNFNSNTSTAVAGIKTTSPTNVTSTALSLFTSKPAENPSSNFCATFGTSANVTSNPSSSTSATFSQSSGVNNTSMSGFGNSFAKSSANSTIQQPLALSSTFASDKKEGGFNFNAPSVSINNTQPLTFGTTTTTTVASGFSMTPLVTSGTTAPAGTFSSQTPSLFNPPSSTPGLFSGLSNTTSMFKSPNTTSASPVVTQPLSFGTTATTTVASGFNATPSVTSSTTAPAGSFGSQAQSLFNAPSSTPSLFSGSSTSTAIFKPNTTSTSNPAPSIFGSSTNPTTGFRAQAAAASTTAAPTLFGNNANNSALPSLFQNAANPTTTASVTPSLPTFGANQNSQAPSIFGSAPPSTTPSIFGSSAVSSPSTGVFSGSSNNVGSAMPNMGATTNPAESTSIFGQNKSPTIAFGASSTSFGNSKSTFPTPTTNASTFSIGNAPASSGLPGFGTIKPTIQFGEATNDTSKSATPIFGSSMNTGFGGTSSSGGFGSPSTASSSGSTFGNTAPGTTPSFGTSSFGNSAAPAVTSPFGTQTTTPAATTSNIFGNTANSAGSSSFSFGGTSTQTQQQQPPASFSFGGSSTAAAGSGVFQFGGSSATQSKPAGFNFNAPAGAPTINFTGGSAAPPAFNSPTNMFSIGSGSTAPRSRTSRSRRQR